MTERNRPRPDACVEDSNQPLRRSAISISLMTAVDHRAAMWLASATICIALSGAAAGLTPLALKHLIDTLGSTGMSGTASGLANAVAPLVAAIFLNRFGEDSQALCYGRGEQLITRRFQDAAYAHVLALPFAGHMERRPGDLSQAISQAAAGISLIATALAVSLAPIVVQLAISAYVISHVAGNQLLAVLAVSLCAYCVCFFVTVKRLTKPIAAYSASKIAIGGEQVGTLVNIESVKSYGVEDVFAARHRNLLMRMERHWNEYLKCRFSNGLLTSLVFSLTVSAAMFSAGAQVLEGRLSTSGLILIGTYVIQLVRPMETIGYALQDIKQGFAFLKETSDLLSIRKEDVTRDSASTKKEMRQKPAAFNVHKVNLHLGSRHVLKDVCLTGEPGSLIGIVGPSGAGKSSVAKMLLRFYLPDSGEITLDGRSIQNIRLSQLREEIALISQENLLFNGTITENVALGRPGATEEEILAAVRRSGLDTVVAQLPEGLSTRVGERGTRLSGGEKQRVLIARATLKMARLLILDEATASLDPISERQVRDALFQLSAGATTIVISHRLATIRAADRIFVLVDGRVVEEGVHDELLRRGGEYLRLWRAQGAE